MTRTIRNDELAHFHSAVRSREISPELVLVDPQLAQIARATPAQDAKRPAAISATPIEIEPQQEQPPIAPLYYALDPPRPVAANAPTKRRRNAAVAGPSRVLAFTAPSILSVSLLINLMLAGVLLAGGGDVPKLVSPEPDSNYASTTELQEETGSVPTTQSQKRSAKASTAAAAPPQSQAGRRRASRTKATAERTVLALVQTAPRSRVAQLIDPKSGLLKNNVQAVCRRLAGRGLPGFLCVVRPVGAPPGAGLYVRYKVGPHGHWSVTWLGYRNG